MPPDTIAPDTWPRPSRYRYDSPRHHSPRPTSHDILDYITPSLLAAHTTSSPDTMDLAAQQSSIQRPHTVDPPPQSSPQHPRHDLPNMTRTTRSWGRSSTLLPTTRLPATHFSTQSPAHGRLRERCPQHSSGRQQHLPAPVATAERHHFT